MGICFTSVKLHFQSACLPMQNAPSCILPGLALWSEKTDKVFGRHSESLFSSWVSRGPVTMELVVFQLLINWSYWTSVVCIEILFCLPPLLRENHSFHAKQFFLF